MQPSASCPISLCLEKKVCATETRDTLECLSSSDQWKFNIVNKVLLFIILIQ
jgi:hypothetical protein